RKEFGWFGFKAVISLSDLPPEPLSFDLQIGTRWSSTRKTIDLKMSNGARGSSRTMAADGRLFHAEPSIDGSTTVLFTGTDTRLGRATWTLRALFRDLATLRHPHRFWRVRWARALSRPLVGRRPIWLIGER